MGGLPEKEKRLGARLRALRKGRGLTQVELAKKAGITQAALCRIEIGQVKAQKGTVRKLASALGVEAHAIGAESPAPVQPVGNDLAPPHLEEEVGQRQIEPRRTTDHKIERRGEVLVVHFSGATEEERLAELSRNGGAEAGEALWRELGWLDEEP